VEFFPQIGHEWQHRPVDGREQVGIAEQLRQAVFAKMLDDRFVGNVVHRDGFTEHQFAVVEFEGVGMTRIGDGVKRRDFLHRQKDFFDRGHAKRADVGDFGRVHRQRVAHDRTVSTKLFNGRNEFDVRRQAAGAFDALREIADGFNAGKRVDRLAFVDGVDDLVDEAVEPDDDVQLGRGFLK